MTTPNAEDFAAKFAAVAPGTCWEILHTSLRQRFSRTSEVLARMCSEGALGLAGVLEAASSKDASAAEWKVDSLYALGCLLCAESNEPRNLESAKVLFDFAQGIDKRRPHSFAESVIADLHLVLGNPQKSLEIAQANSLSRSNLSWTLNVFGKHPRFGNDVENWLEILNQPFERNSLIPVTLKDKSKVRFDELTGANDGAARATVPGKLVSVIMSVFNPDESLRTSIESILNQTWANLELIVVDDANPAEEAQFIKSMCATDDRIKYLRLDQNGGTYAARNAALKIANGFYIGFQDSDDWSHPQRLEETIRTIESNPGLVGAWCTGTKLNDDLFLSKIGRPKYAKITASLIFKKDVVIEAVGNFDLVRKSADSEFVDRIKKHFEEDAVALLDVPLYFHRVGNPSLTNDDFKMGWADFSRWAYKGSYLDWHRRSRGNTPLQLERKQFWAPPEFIDENRTDVDIAILGEIHDPYATSVAMAFAESTDVALIHGESLWRPRAQRRHPGREVWSALAKQNIQLASLNSNFAANTLLVTEPEVLTWEPELIDTHLRVGEIIIIGSREPHRGAEKTLFYHPEGINKYCEKYFGVTPTWVPRTHEISRQLESFGCKVTTPITAFATLVSPRPRPPRNEKLVVGFIKTADSKLAKSLVETGFDVRVRVDRFSNQFDPNVQRHIEPSLIRFLDQIDILVDTNPAAPPTLSWHAAARGVACVSERRNEFAEQVPRVETEEELLFDQIKTVAHNIAEHQAESWKWACEHLSTSNFSNRINEIKKLVESCRDV